MIGFYIGRPIGGHVRIATGDAAEFFADLVSEAVAAAIAVKTIIAATVALDTEAADVTADFTLTIKATATLEAADADITTDLDIIIALGAVTLESVAADIITSFLVVARRVSAWFMITRSDRERDD